MLALLVLAAVTLAGLAQARDATNAEISLVRQQLLNVAAAVGALDEQLRTYVGAQDTVDLAKASFFTVNTLDNGTAAVQTVQGTITAEQTRAQLLGPVAQVNAIVVQSGVNAEAKKPLFERLCIGPVILARIKLQRVAANTFRDSISAKLSLDDRYISDEASQPALDAIAGLEAFYADQETAPANCTAATPSASASATSASRSPSRTSAIGSATSAAVYTGGASAWRSELGTMIGVPVMLVIAAAAV